MSSDPKPAVSYWHLWTDADGVSHQSRCAMTEFEKAAIQPEAAPQPDASVSNVALPRMYRAKRGLQISIPSMAHLNRQGDAPGGRASNCTIMSTAGSSPSNT